MNYEGVHSVIINGFDRSGSSAISRTLSQHPDIELFMQPFNSGPVREKMYQIWTDDTATDADIRFFKGLEEGVLFRDYIRSHWFERYSSTSEFIPGRIHLLKTTINHFLTDWCQKRFPAIHQWAIWRDPWQIHYSLMVNDFASQWYTDALQEITSSIQRNPVLDQHYGTILQEDLSTREELALLIAVRSHYLFQHIPSENVLFYEEFIGDSDRELRRFLSFYGLNLFSFGSADDDLNIAGARQSAEDRSSAIADWKDIDGISRIFAPLIELMNERFPDKVFSEYPQ